MEKELKAIARKAVVSDYLYGAVMVSIIILIISLPLIFIDFSAILVILMY